MKTLFKPILILVLLLWTMGGGVLTAYAEIPHLINYQGKLTETDGSPITATKQITFRIYDVLSGGTPLWEETQPITINKGVFSTMLGSIVDLNLPFDQPYYLEIKVADEVMTPRQRIASAGYAFRAEEVDSIPRGVIVMWSGAITNIPNGWALADGTNGTPDLRDRFVVGAGSSYSVDATGGATTHAHGAGSYAGGTTGSTALSVSQMPAHTHSITFYGGSGTSPSRKAVSGTTPGAVSTSSTGSGAGHTHTGGTVTGTSASVSSLPPYYALAYIMKL